MFLKKSENLYGVAIFNGTLTHPLHGVLRTFIIVLPPVEME